MTERKNRFFSFSILPPWSNFIFSAIISIYQLINNPINTGVFWTWNKAWRTVLRTNQKSFPSNDITYFFNGNTFFPLKNPYLKSVFFKKKKYSLRVVLNMPGFEKSLYVRAYVRKWRIGGRTKIIYN